ncbi:hypothetical protein JCM5296_004894 [Sporobolomyces johnsonii]
MLYTLTFTAAMAGLAAAATTALPYTSTVDGTDYVWKSTVAYGELPATLVDAFGDSLGGIGSAIAVKRWRSNGDGTYSGTIVAQPDRGHNTVSLENYGARQQYIDFVLRPCAAATCNTDASAPSLSLTYTGGMKYIDASPRNQNGGYTSGLDAVNVRPASGLFTELPEVEDGNNALSTDMEGLALMADGSFWSSDEYGPSIYHISADGTILSNIPVPDAFLPHTDAGVLDFATEEDVNLVSGRAPNQGFEGLTISPDNTRLYALLQSALLQDQDLSDDTTIQFTRLLVYDITNVDDPSLIEEYVVELPKSSSKVYAASEVHYVNDNTLLVLARDGKGNGNGNSPSSTATTKQLTSDEKEIGIISLVGATNIVGLYDGVGEAVAPNGVLDSSVTPVAFNNLISIIDAAQLARFGLQNGPPLATDIVGKFGESLAIAPALDPANPDDYFVFTLADNDFINTDEYFDGVSQGPDPYLLDRSLNPSGLARRRIRRSDNCAPHLDACSLGGGRFECVDVASDLEQCGACSADGGVDCASLPGVAGVECVQGACVIDSCTDEFKLVEDACVAI